MAIESYQSGIDSLSGIPEFPKKAAPSYFNMGNAYYFLNDLFHAAEAFSNAIAGNPSHKDYHFNMGNTEKELQHYKKAIFHFKTVFKLDTRLTYGNTESALLSLATIYQDHKNDKRRAKGIYERIIELYPENKSALFGL